MRSTLVSVATLLVGLSIAAPAQAAPDWSPPTPLPAGWSTASLGFDATGAQTVGHLDIISLSPLVTRVGLATRGLDGSYSEQLGLDSVPGDAPAAVEVAVAPNGAAVACIARLIGPVLATAKQRFTATYRPAGSASWEPPELLSENTAAGSSEPCRVAIGPGGVGTVVHAPTTSVPPSPQEAVSQVRLAVHPPGGSWTTTALSSAGLDAQSARIAVDAADTTTVVWRERYAGAATADPIDDRYAIRSRVRSGSNGVLGLTQNVLVNDVFNAYAPSLGVGPDGRAIVAWQWARSEPQAWVAERGTASGNFGAPTQLVANGSTSSSEPVAAGMSPGGAGHVLYASRGSNSGLDRLELVRRPAGGAFSAPADASPRNFASSTGSIAFLGNDAFTVYSGVLARTSPAETDLLQGVRWGAAAPTFEGFRDLVPPPTDVRAEGLIADNDGSLVAVYVDEAAGRPGVVAYDGGAPKLLSASVPPTASTGVAIALSATFADAWSSVEPTRWDFGDGTPGATGTTVTHSWAAPATFTVKATGRDARGNELTRSFPVTVTTPPAPGPAAPVAPGEPLPPVPGGPLANQPDRARPLVTISLPTCPKKLSRASCRRRRGTLGAWRTVSGTAKDAGGVRRVTLTARRARKGTIRAKTVRATATRRGTRWTAKVKGLTTGRWTFTVVATDTAGNRSVAARRSATLRRRA